MGCYIHAYAEKRVGTNYEMVTLKFWDIQNYRLYAFLAGVRNSSGIKPLAEPKGLPPDVSAVVAAKFDSWGGDAHSESWHDLKTLLEFDYNQMVEDRRCAQQVAPNWVVGNATATPGQGEVMPLVDFLCSSQYFDDLQLLKEAEVERVVFWFDS